MGIRPHVTCWPTRTWFGRGTPARLDRGGYEARLESRLSTRKVGLGSRDRLHEHVERCSFYINRHRSNVRRIEESIVDVDLFPTLNLDVLGKCPWKGDAARSPVDEALQIVGEHLAVLFLCGHDGEITIRGVGVREQDEIRSD